MIEIPARLRSFRFIKVRPNKAPLEKDWQNTNNYAYDDPEFQKWIKHNQMYGVATGFHNLVVLDFDSKEVQDAVVPKLPETFTQRSAGRGLLHLFYFMDDPQSMKVMDLAKNTLIDVQGIGKQVIGPGSTLLNNKQYQVVNDREIAHLSRHELQKALAPYLNIEKQVSKQVSSIESDPVCAEIKDKTSVPDQLRSYGVDTSRNPTTCPMHSSKGGRCLSFNNEVFNCFHCGAKGNLFHLVMAKEGLSFFEAKQKLSGNSQLATVQPKKTIMESRLNLKTYRDFEALKKDNNYIVQDFLKNQSINMVCSPPKTFKSLLIQHCALCVANNKQFLGLKTKKVPILISDRENTDQVNKDRLQKQRKGLSIRKKDFQIYWLEQTVAGFDSPDFRTALIDIIKEKKIKLFIIDTLHRHSDYDENSANDINRLYAEVLQPLRDNYGVTIVFLHHTTKDGLGFRGSGDFLGMVDSYFAISRKAKTNKFVIQNRASRFGEIEDISGEIIFDMDSIYIKTLSAEAEKTQSINKLKEATNKVYSLFQGGAVFQRKDILLRLDNDDITVSESTIRSALKFLVDQGKLQTDGKGKYSLYGAEVEAI